MKVALFDFDGTITSRDSFLLFLVHAVGWARVATGSARLGPWLALFVLGLASNEETKARVLEHFFKGWAADEFRACAKHFAECFLPGIVRPSALERILWHRDRGHRTIIVSASIEDWIAPWSEKYGLELIGTRVEVNDGKLTGGFATSNCYGPEKVRRIRDHVPDLDQAEFIYAYGDSRGDREMMLLAGEAHFRPFRERRRTKD